jgi:hypothetical protein
VRIQIEPSAVDLSIEIDGEPREGDLTIIDGAAEDATARVRIEVLGFGIALRTPSWRTGLADLTLMFVDETRLLFLGAKRMSCAVDLARSQVAHVFEHTLFWGFDRTTRPGWILETGELDCLFRALDGRVVAQVPVDPPWESTVDTHGIRFESMVNGVTFLRFPDAGPPNG